MKKVHISHISHIPCIFDVHPPIWLTSLWVVWCVKAMHHAVHSTMHHSHEYWREFGGSLEGVHRRKLNGPHEESADINYFVEVHDQVQAKK